jgi:hypothetical protein
LALLHLAFNVAENLALAVLSFRALPTLRLSPALVDAATFRRVRGYSLDAFLLLIAGRLAYQTDSFVIGANLPLEAITYFAIAARLSEFAKTLLRTITSTLTPGISAMEARGEVAGIRDLYTQAARWVLYLTVPVQLGLLVYGGDFLSLWLRSTDYARASGPTLDRAGGGLGRGHGAIGGGAGVVRHRADSAVRPRLAHSRPSSTWGLSLLLVRWLGIVGVALGTALPAAGGWAVCDCLCVSADRPASADVCGASGAGAGLCRWVARRGLADAATASDACGVVFAARMLERGRGGIRRTGRLAEPRAGRHGRPSRQAEP